MKVLKIILLWFGATILLLQFIKIEVPPAPKAKAEDEINAPKEIKALLKRSCYACHSNEAKLPWYGKISPINLQVASNIKNGRRYLNFSIWNKYTQEQKQERYKKIVSALKIKMPPAEYLLFHKEARISPKERKMLQDWAKSHIKEDENN